jgi:hypothetical protein
MTEPFAAPEWESASAKCRRRFTGGIMLIILGMIIGPGMIVAGVAYVFYNMPEGHQFAAPGEHTLHIAEPGRHTLWHETRGVFQGQIHSSPRLPVGMRIEILSEQTGETLPIQSRTSAASTMGSTERKSLGNFDVQAPGDYRVRAHGSEEAAVLYVAPDMLAHILGVIFGITCSGLIGLGMIVGGTVLVIVNWSKRRASPGAIPATPSDS